MYALALEHSEEVFHGCVVAAMTDGTHAAGDAMICEELLIAGVRELRATNPKITRVLGDVGTGNTRQANSLPLEFLAVLLPILQNTAPAPSWGLT